MGRPSTGLSFPSRSPSNPAFADQIGAHDSYGMIPANVKPNAQPDQGYKTALKPELIRRVQRCSRVDLANLLRSRIRRAPGSVIRSERVTVIVIHAADRDRCIRGHMLKV